jgi:nucleoid DNA-binding protein
MNKKELVQSIALESSGTQPVAEAVLNAFMDSITNALKCGDKVSLAGFGTFQAKERPAREGRNPKTGEALQIAASIVPGFKAGKALKGAIN